MTDKGVATLLAGLGPVLIPEGLKLSLHGVKDRVVLVHRSLATIRTLTESKDFGSVPAGHAGGQPIPSGCSLAMAMNLGEVYLESLSTGIITQQEIDWITTHQGGFAREEEAMALKLGRLLDEGSLQIGCRLFSQPPNQQPSSPQG
jgi:hypothetical protein